MLFDPWLVTVNLIVATALFILILIIQLVHYPLFFYLDSANFKKAMLEHQKNITWIVAPLMLAEVIVVAILLISNPQRFFGDIVLVFVVWLSTFFTQVPLHRRLLETYKPSFVKNLIKTNRIRTTAWGLRFVLAISLFISNMNP